MKIAMFTDSYRPQINGLVTSMDAFVDELRRQGHEVIIFAPSSPNYKDTDKDVRRIKSVEFSNYKEYRIGLPFKLMVRPDLHGVDIIHVQSPFSMGITGLMIAKQMGIPCVATFHTLFNEYAHYLIKNRFISSSRNFRKLFSKISWSYVSWFYNTQDVVIAPSMKIKSVIKKNGVKKHVEVVPTGMRFAARLPKKSLRRRYKFGGEKIILHVGRITTEKNIEFILKSLRPYLMKKDWKFIITSDGPYRTQLEGVAKSLGISDKVIFTGYLSQKALQEYYAMADVFVMASKTETQGLVLLEAANQGLPCVVLDAPVISDFVRENKNGLVAGNLDFASVVSRLLTNKTLYRKASRNSSKVRKNYSIEKCSSMLLKAYEKALVTANNP